MGVIENILKELREINQKLDNLENSSVKGGV